MPPLPGTTQDGVFVYRTIEDLEAIAAWGRSSRRAAVIGGGLLGLEAAKAARDMGLETSVIEVAPRLMPRQLDAAGAAVLRRAIEALGVRVHTDARIEALLGVHGQVTALQFKEGPELPVDMVIVSAGIRPRDELAREAGVRVGQRGGIAVDDSLATSAPNVYAIGECALHRDGVYGLVAPGYAMADVLAARLCGADRTFDGRRPLDRAQAARRRRRELRRPVRGRVGRRGRERVRRRAARDLPEAPVLARGRAAGRRDPRGRRGALRRAARAVPRRRARDRASGGAAVRRGPGGRRGGRGERRRADLRVQRRLARRDPLRDRASTSSTTVGGIKACTRAGTGCGGCVPQLTQILTRELERAGRTIDRNLCEHFAYTRQQLFEIVKIGRIKSFDALLASHGKGNGCEVCRPAVASILASRWNDPILDHATIQDTNDRYLANIQRGGTYSVIPRIPGGEITPAKLIVLGEIARKYDLYVKITGGQRIDLLGARVEQLPEIWEELVAAGFESGHAYGKAMRTVKSCIGSTWCRYGVQDSVAFAIRVEERYRGIRAPHKLKSAVSGCIRECAEAQSKDFGIIATEKGWNLYLAGNGGTNPRHADLVASDVDEATVLRLIDRFLMYYIHTANPLERTARWVERQDGGIDYVKSVIVDDALGICADLDRDMQALVDSYRVRVEGGRREPGAAARVRALRE